MTEIPFDLQAKLMNASPRLINQREKCNILICTTREFCTKSCYVGGFVETIDLTVPGVMLMSLGKER